MATLATNTRAWEHVDLPLIHAHYAQPAGLTRLLALSGTRLDILYALLAAVTGAELSMADAPNTAATAAKVADVITEHIVRIYEEELCHRPELDKWVPSAVDISATGPRGRDLFRHTVSRFVRRGAPIHFVLPAFPCKTSNLEKVAGTLPDKGEELALRTTRNFLDRIDTVYPPGAVFHIVSDGHVFADLIGVGDSTVDAYSAALRDMATHLDSCARSAKAGARRSPSRIVLHGLEELLRPHPFLFACLGISLRDEHAALRQIAASFAERTSYSSSPQPNDAAAPRHVHASSSSSSSPSDLGPLSVLSPDLQPEVELRRNILVGVFGSRRLDAIDARIKEDPPSLALFRGFARFLLEDIGSHPRLFQSSATSSKQRKRICERLAKLMIQRNDAYSRLVEVRFPGAVRLSIHPHDNSGPKFAVCLIHARYRAGANSDLRSDRSILHIPTPWHNVVLQVPPTDGGAEDPSRHTDGNYIVLKRSEVPLHRPDDRHEIVFEPWRPHSEHPSGGFFYFRRRDL